MPPVSYDLLRSFVAVARSGSFSRASREQRVSVSAVSQRMRTLEAQLGFALFERVGRRVRLSPAGARLRARLEGQFARVEDALTATADEQGAVRGRVTIGSPRTFGARWLRPRLPALLRAEAELQLEVQFDVPSVLERRLADGTLDLAVLVRPSQLPGIVTTPVARESFLAVAAPGAWSGAAPPRTLEEFQAQRWAVFDADLPMHAPWWRATFGPKAALPQRIVCEVASLEELLSIAAAGAALTVLPDYVVEPAVADGRLLVLAPSEGTYRRRRPAGNTIFLAWRSGAAESARFRAVRAALSAPPRGRAGR